MMNSWLVVVPPILVIVLATVTRRMLFSLILGIVSAALIANNFLLMPSLEFMGARFWKTTELSTIMSWDLFWANGIAPFICVFLIVLGILITMIQHSGAAYAYGNVVMKKIKTARSAEISSLLLSTLFFIDDYFGCLMVGAVMQPITDRFKIPRVKLAMIACAVAAPFALLVPLSSWVAYVVGQLRSTGVSPVAVSSTIIIAEPLYLYVKIIPFMLYELLIVASLWYMVIRRVSYGVFGNQEDVAQKTGNLFGGKPPVVRNTIQIPAERMQSARLIDFILPLALLFISVIGWIFYTGGWWLFGGTNTLFGALQKSNTSACLFVGTLFTVVVTGLLFLFHKRLTVAELPMIFKEGCLMFGRSIMMLLLIWTLSSILSRDLKTGQYLASYMMGHMSVALLPAVFFIMTATISVLMATAWGTVGMVVPLGLGMIPSLFHVATPCHLSDVPFILPVLGAIISGAILGNHVSPIADIMIMSATSAGAYHMDVVKCQMSFAIPTFISSLIGFGCVGLLMENYGVWVSAIIALGIGFMCNVVILTLLTYWWKRFKKVS
jgi:tetracycline resistance efflux pump